MDGRKVCDRINMGGRSRRVGIEKHYMLVGGGCMDKLWKV
jgi:molybdopterin-guanine dinucleotide biosynthesis protein A